MAGKLLGPLLLGILIVSATLNLGVSAWLGSYLAELHKLQAWVQYINSTQTAAQSLASESVEYAKQHPALEPILQRFMKAKTAPAPPSVAPAPKPSR